MYVSVLQTEGAHGARFSFQRVHGVGVVGVGHDHAALGDPVGEGAEGVLHILQIAEKVQMVGLNVQNDRHGGVKGEEGVAVFAALQDDGVPAAHPMARAQQGQGAADHDGGVQPGGHDDVGAHGSGGGLAVGARDAQRVFVAAHDGAPGLGAFKDRDTQGAGPGDLGIVVMYGGGADDQVRALHALGPMADGHGNAQRAQMGHRGALMQVGAGNDHPHALEHLGQRGHGYPADADQMGPAAGNDEIMNAGCCHRVYTPSFQVYNGYESYIINHYRRIARKRYQKAVKK